MNWDPSFTRKVIYILLLVLLVFPIGFLGLPASRDAAGRTQAGGFLSQQRLAQGLAQSQLGEIDPASETMRLATFGMQGVASVFLWNAATDYKEREEWDNLQAVLNQLVKLQPNFLEVWRHQGWNVAYNVSVEFDDYKYRYHWVKKGLEILVEGTHYNRDDPKLLEYVGWVYGHKFGRSDEHVQFRRMFRDDLDYHQQIADEGIPMDKTIGPLGRPDNWLVSYEWYLKAHDAVRRGKPIKGTSHLLFYSYPGMQRINYADAIEDEGFLSDAAQLAWQRAAAEWKEYGGKTIPTSWGVDIRLNDLDRGLGGRGFQGEIVQLKAELDKLAPGVRKKLVDERRAKLSKEELKALDMKPEERRPEDFQLAATAEAKVQVTHKEVAEAAPEADRAAALVVAEQLGDTEEIATYMERYRQIVNFTYWRTRCDVEQTNEALEGRRLIRDAKELFLVDTNFEKARATFEKAWDKWAVIYEGNWSGLGSQASFRDVDKNKDGRLTRDEAPLFLRDNFDEHDADRNGVLDEAEYIASKSNDPLKQELLTDETSDTVFEAIEHYRDLLEQMKQPFPRDFKLKMLLDAKGVKWHLVGGENKATTPEKKPGDTPEKKPADAPEKKPGDELEKKAPDKPADAPPAKAAS